MQTQPLVSVLMPCYNAAATLEEALASLESQTLVGFELIVVDDGSTDGTPELMRVWAERDTRLKLVYQPHSGIIAALNTGLAHCRAPLVARMDSDDRCRPQRLEQQVDFLDRHPEIGLVSCRVEAFPAADVRTGFQIYLDWLNALLTDAEICREIFVESPLPHPSVTFRRALVAQAGGYQEHGWPEDYDLWLRLYLRQVRFARLPEVLLSWRERLDRLTRCDSRYSLENFLRAKACYLARGPLAGRETVFIWGAGMMGRRLARQLEHQAVPVKAFFDVDPLKIGRTRRGRPVLAPSDFLPQWRQASHPALLAAVGARGARPLIRQRLQAFALVEGQDWWFAA